MENEEIRNLIPEQCRADFDGIVSGRILGASKHIKMIFGIIREIAQGASDSQDQEDIRKIVRYFEDTRGQSSYAIINAMKRVERKIITSDAEAYNKRVINSIDSYFKEEAADLEKILAFSAGVLEGCSTVMVFDYSSTVEKALRCVKKPLQVIIPESRVINGGLPFVEPLVKAGHQIHFIPDAGMLSVLRQCDAVLIGAETFYPDGTAFNTCGSDVLAELCYLHQIPYHVVTPLLKVDPRAQYGIYKKPIVKDLKAILSKEWAESLTDKVDFSVIELTPIRPEHITFYITEKGVVRPSGIASLVTEEVRNAG